MVDFILKKLLTDKTLFGRKTFWQENFLTEKDY